MLLIFVCEIVYANDNWNGIFEVSIQHYTTSNNIDRFEIVYENTTCTARARWKYLSNERSFVHVVEVEYLRGA